MTMRAAASLLALLLLNATSAFQLYRGARNRLNTGLCIGHLGADGYEVNADGTTTISPVGRPLLEAKPLVTTRAAFLAQALAASSLPISLFNFPAFAADTAGPPEGAATYAYRSGGLASLRPLGLTKLLTRYEGYVEAPASYAKSQIPIAFDFPSDWLQLDKLGGGIQYVDQRNGDKLYVLRAALPEGSDLKGVGKQWFADVVLGPGGDVARSGVVAEGGRVSRSQMVVDCAAEDAPDPCTARRRMVLKYDTVTGSGVQTVERRGLIDAVQVGGDVYMMLATSNAVKFEQKGSKERETVDNIVGSFRIGPGALL